MPRGLVNYNDRKWLGTHTSLVKGKTLLSPKWQRRSATAMLECASCGRTMESYYVQHIFCTRCFPKLLEGACITQPDKLCEVCHINSITDYYKDGALFKKSALRSNHWSSRHFHYCISSVCRGILSNVQNEVRNRCRQGAYGGRVPNTPRVCRGKSDTDHVREVYSGRGQATKDFYALLEEQRQQHGIFMPEWLSEETPYVDLQKPRKFSAEQIFWRVGGILSLRGDIHHVDPYSLPKRSNDPIAYRFPPLSAERRRELASVFGIHQQTVRAIYRAKCLNQKYEECFERDIQNDVKRETHAQRNRIQFGA